MRSTWPPTWPEDPRRLRLFVLAAALLSACVKLVIAARTFGTNDVHYWTEFAQGVRDFGPIGIYGHTFVQIYNHPPLAGWMMTAMNWLVDQGMHFPFLIRVPAPLADVGTAILLFEILRRRLSAQHAAAAAVLFVMSPLMIIVSGFHGNTDPVFTFVSLLTVYLVVVRGQYVSGGLAFGLAVSIKLVPIVLAPMLLVLLLRRGVGPTLKFTAGGLLVFLVLWLPVLVLRAPEFTDQVLNYAGIPVTEWGVPKFLDWMGVGEGGVMALRDYARFPVLLVSSLVPAYIVWRRPQAWTVAFGLAFSLFLLLSPAFGMQYLVWPLSAAYLIDWRSATVYNAAASVFAYAVYANWSGNRWWGWYEAVALGFSPSGLVLMTLTWATLLLVVSHGVLDVRRQLRLPLEPDVGPSGETAPEPIPAHEPLMSPRDQRG